MIAVLIRHGLAVELSELRVERGDPALDDSARPLTELGRRRVRRAARGLRRLGVRPEVMFHSGAVRARETAELLARRLKPREPELLATDALLHSADPRDIFPVLARARADCVVCVGHCPNLDRIVAFACGAPNRLVTSLGKASAVCLELPASGRPAGRIVWLLTPKMVRRFAG